MFPVSAAYLQDGENSVHRRIISCKVISKILKDGRPDHDVRLKL